MQVDVSTVIALVSAICSFALGAWLFVARIAISNREKEIDRRHDELRKRQEEMDLRLHTEEKSTIRQDGDLRLVQNTHDNLANDLQEIKRTMATKAELQHINRTTEQILARIDGRPSPRGFPSGGYTSTSEPASPKPIPRREPSRPDRDR